jgi:hypothetical protein
LGCAAELEIKKIKGTVRFIGGSSHLFVEGFVALKIVASPLFTKTRVSGPAKRAFDEIIRRDDLGLQYFVRLT